MIDGMQKIIDILRTPEYPQGTGALAHFSVEGKIADKCALGEISCRVGLEVTPLNIDSINYKKILLKAGLPADMVEISFMPDYDMQYVDENNQYLTMLNFDKQTTILSVWIYRMNDAGFTYNQIADFLETTFQDWEE